MSQDGLRDFQLSETEEYLAARLDNALEELTRLNRAHSKLKKEVRTKNRIIQKLKDEKPKKRNHYKNGKRGTNFNG